jgi:hypothetical protein
MSSICALVLALAIGFGLNNCRKQKAKENDLAQ